MQQPFECTNLLDNDGKPAGGTASATGVKIEWQNGPLGRGEDRKEPNGAFVETLLGITRARILWYNDSGFECPENTEALEAIDTALAALNKRTERRENQGVEGTHEGS